MKCPKMFELLRVSLCISTSKNFFFLCLTRHVDNKLKTNTLQIRFSDFTMFTIEKQRNSERFTNTLNIFSNNKNRKRGQKQIGFKLHIVFN